MGKLLIIKMPVLLLWLGKPFRPGYDYTNMGIFIFILLVRIHILLSWAQSEVIHKDKASVLFYGWFIKAS